MVVWIRLSFLFGIVAPVLVWDNGILAEHLMAVTLVWFSVSIAAAFFVLLFFAILNRFILMFAINWAEKYIAVLRVWGLLILFLGYLAVGIRFSSRIFS